MAKYSDKEIEEETFYLHEYHKYWLVFREVRNPDSNRLTGLIMDLKEESCANHTNAVQLFGRELVASLENFFDDDEEFYAAIVPSHSKGCVSSGMRAIIRHAKTKYNILNGRNLLNRHTTVPKAAHGGSRALEVHLNSIEVHKNLFPDGATILLVDDVSTTGNSLAACEQLLKDNGAGKIVAIAIAQSVEEI